MIAHQTSEPSGDCYVALELSRSKWLTGAILPGQEKIKTTTVAGGDTAALIHALDDIVSSAKALDQPNARLHVCFEAEYDGFWLARFLADSGIDVTVIDAASFLVSRRGRHIFSSR